MAFNVGFHFFDSFVKDGSNLSQWLDGLSVDVRSPIRVTGKTDKRFSIWKIASLARQHLQNGPRDHEITLGGQQMGGYLERRFRLRPFR
jgi:hypothetical protein